jgi:hypothetical protein
MNTLENIEVFVFWDITCRNRWLIEECWGILFLTVNLLLILGDHHASTLYFLDIFTALSLAVLSTSTLCL